MKCEKNRIKRKKWFVIICFSALFCSSCHLYPDFEKTDEYTGTETEEDRSNRPSSHTDEGMAADSEDTDAEQHTASCIYVHVCGCVRHPGLYTARSGLRVGEAVKLAGGFTKHADQNAVNLASVLKDGMQVYVPSKTESTAMDSAKESGENAATDDRVNLNSASAEELMTLFGVGEAKAENIIIYREENGPFSSIEEIKNVSGIGDGIFEKIKDFITV